MYVNTQQLVRQAPTWCPYILQDYSGSLEKDSLTTRGIENPCGSIAVDGPCREEIGNWPGGEESTSRLLVGSGC